MNNNKILWFLCSFVITFGSYLYFHIVGNWNEGYGVWTAGIVAFLYIIFCLLAFFSLKGLNKPLALGFLWGLISILIFLFTIGGCGMLR